MDGRQRDDGTLVPRQFLLGDAPAVEEQQRRQEQQEEDVGIEHHAQVAERGDDGAEGDLHQRQRNGKGRRAR